MNTESLFFRPGRISAILSAVGSMPKAWDHEMLSVLPAELPVGFQFYVAPHHDDVTPSWTLSPLTLLPGQSFCIRSAFDPAGLICPDSFSFSCSAVVSTVRITPCQGLTGAKHGVYGRKKNVMGADYRRCRTVLGWRL